MSTFLAYGLTTGAGTNMVFIGVKINTFKNGKAYLEVYHI